MNTSVDVLKFKIRSNPLNVESCLSRCWGRRITTTVHEQAQSTFSVLLCWAFFKGSIFSVYYFNILIYINTRAVTITRDSRPRLFDPNIIISCYKYCWIAIFMFSIKKNFMFYHFTSPSLLLYTICIDLPCS